MVGSDVPRTHDRHDRARIQSGRGWIEGCTGSAVEDMRKGVLSPQSTRSTRRRSSPDHITIVRLLLLRQTRAGGMTSMPATRPKIAVLRVLRVLRGEMNPFAMAR